MASPLALVLLAIALLSSLVPTTLVGAIYADEAGTYDWTRHAVGIPKFSFFQTIDKVNSLFVATDRNVLAQLETKTGEIVWRQVLEPDDNILSLISDKETLLSVSGKHSLHARLWSAKSGQPLWDYSLEDVRGADSAAALYLTDKASDDVAVLVQDTLFRISGRDGAVIWRTSLDEHGDFSGLAQVGDKLYVYGKDVHGHVVLYTTDVDSGKLLQALPVSEKETITGEYALLKSAKGIHLSWLTKDGHLALRNLAHDTKAAKLLDAEEYVQGSASLRQLSAGVDAVVVSGSDAHVVLAYDDELQTLKNVHSFARKQSDDLVASYASDKHAYIALASKLMDTFALDIFDVNLGTALPSRSAPLAPHFDGPLTLAAFHISAKRTESSQPQFLLSSTSGSLVLIKGEKTTWSREESLAHATKAQFVDLPESSLLSEEYNELDEGQTHRDISSPVERYLRRLSSHASKALSFLIQSADALSKGKLPSFGERAPLDQKQLFRDTHGIHKLIVFATKTGKVVALDTLKGVVVWTYYLPNSQIRHVDLVRDALVKFPPVLTISVESNLSNESTLVLLDALKGSPYSPSANVPAKATFSQLPKIIIKLPVDEPESRIHPLAVVGSDLKIRLFPDSEEAHRAFETVRSAMHFYLSGGVGSSSVRGYAVSSDAHVQGAYSTVQTWEFKLPDGETLAAISERSNGENVASMGRVLGDRSVLYKYLNPNTVGIVSVKAALPDHTTAYFYLLDSVTGRLYFSRAHQAAGIVSATTPSIQLLMCENFVVYTYWNHGPGASNVADPLPESFDHETDEKTRRRKMKKAQRAHTGTLVPDVKGLEVVVMELFESIKPDERDESRNYTSYSLQVPHVLTQAYSFPYTVTSIGVTTTKMGITTREILFGLKNGQLYGVNKRLLDPRRPLAAPTANDKEEMLVPYRPQIDYNPKDVASYHIEVNGIEHIQASAAVLESTSLVVAFGLDVFFTRRHPSKMFDVLSEDFNYAALILTIVALFVSIYVSKYMVERKKLREQWK